MRPVSGKQWIAGCAVLALVVGACGCAGMGGSSRRGARHPSLGENDRVWFVQGTGGGLHWGDIQLRSSLRKAGSPMKVVFHHWHKDRLPGQIVLTDDDYRLVKRAARQLVAMIGDFKRDVPEGEIYIVGQSAGCEVVRLALAQLPEGCSAQNVVMLQPSVSADAPLADALAHVEGKLYYTSSPHDHLLSVGTGFVGTTDRKHESGAGYAGFHAPQGSGDDIRRLYREKLVEVRWKPSMIWHGWPGDHASLLGPGFMDKHVVPMLAGAYRR